ncbi:perlucin-like protein [Ruditapes philippinarum]|uniref:perlucin-like protein n=1 Tax=Ruditapes philippinarum TaxID=129788 RepID=UPI00295AF825|nr:perlucin-like protein [Ruditapes philippinarum]
MKSTISSSMIYVSKMKASIIWFIIIANHAQGISCKACCDDGWISYKFHCYLIGHKERTFMEAHHFCYQQGAYLVRIDNYWENKFLKDLLRNLKVSDTWTGLSDQRSEGIWRWFNTDRHASMSDWGPGEPNNNGNEDCVGFWPRINYDWNDYECNSKLRPLCEKP